MTAMFTTLLPASADVPVASDARAFQVRFSPQTVAQATPTQVPPAVSMPLDVNVLDFSQAAGMYARLTELSDELDLLLERYQGTAPNSNATHTAALRTSLDDLVDDASLLVAALRGMAAWA